MSRNLQFLGKYGVRNFSTGIILPIKTRNHIKWQVIVTTTVLGVITFSFIELIKRKADYIKLLTHRAYVINHETADKIRWLQFKRSEKINKLDDDLSKIRQDVKYNPKKIESQQNEIKQVAERNSEKIKIMMNDIIQDAEHSSEKFKADLAKIERDIEHNSVEIRKANQVVSDKFKKIAEHLDQ